LRRFFYAPKKTLKLKPSSFGNQNSTTPKFFFKGVDFKF
jgi:hypothetical protein